MKPLRFLTEAELKDIFSKYYSKNFSDEDFWTIVKSDPTYDENRPQKMGKYAKWLLTNVKLKKLKLEDLYKTTETLTAFNKFNSRLEIKDISKYKSPEELYNAVKEYINSDEAESNSELVRRKKAGAEHVYEDPEWLVVVPKTHEASVYYGRNTRWCTAMKDNDAYFKSYSKDGPLYINIRKEDGAKFQFHFQSNSFMNAEDEPIYGSIEDEIGLNENILKFYENINSDYSYELTRYREDEDEEPEAEVLLLNDRVRVLYQEDEYRIEINYLGEDGEYYEVDIYNGEITDGDIEQIKDPLAEVITPEVIKIIKEYLTDNEFYKMCFGNYYIKDVSVDYYELCKEYVLCYHNNNNEAVIYFCDERSYQHEEVVNFMEDEMHLVEEPSREKLHGIEYIQVEDEDGLKNVFDIKKERYVFENGSEQVYIQKNEKVVFSLPDNIETPVTMYLDGKMYDVPQCDETPIINISYNRNLPDILIVNTGDDMKLPAEKRNMKLRIYSIKDKEYVTDVYNSLSQIHQYENSQLNLLGICLIEADENRIPYERLMYNYQTKDEEKLSEYANKYGYIIGLCPDSDADVVLKDEIITRTEFLKNIGVYDLCKKVYYNIFKK